MSDLYDGQQRIAAALERMQKVQEYQALCAWAGELSSHDKQYQTRRTKTRFARMTVLNEELWPDA